MQETRAIYFDYPKEDGAKQRWLEKYTWIQEDGTIDFSRPRVRPEGLEIDERELEE